MLLRNLIASVKPTQAPRAAGYEGPWELADFRTGELLSAGHGTEAGIPVSAESANGFHAWYRAISLLAQKAAAVPRYVYKPTKNNRGKLAAEEHTAYSLISRRANEFQTAFQFWLQMTGHVASRGNGYAYLDRKTSRGPVTELIPCDPDHTYPVRESGKLYYVMYPFGMEAGEKGYKIKSEDVLHFKGFGFDGLVGYPVWEIAANEIAAGRAERKLVSSRFRNSGRPGMILETDQKLNKQAKDRIREDWERMHTGLDNVGKTAVLDGGLKARPIAMTAEELQQSGAANMSLIAISNYTGVPVTKLGGGKPFATQEQEDRSFVNDGLDFYLNLEDDECAAKLLTEADAKAGYTVASDRESLIRPDIKTLIDFLRTATGGKPIITQNEGRERLDMPPTEEEGADILGTPLNVGQGGFANEPTDPVGNPPGRPKKDATAPDDTEGEDVDAKLSDAARFAIAHATTRMVKRAGNQAAQAAGKGSSAYVDFVEAFRTVNRGVFKSEFATASRVLEAIGKDSRDVHEYLLTLVYDDYEKLIDGATEKTISAKVAETYKGQLLALPDRMCSVFLEPDPQED